MRQIAPGLHYFTGLMVGRVYLIEDPDGLTVIDTSLSFAANRIAAQLEAMRRKPGDVKRILITHAHPDHVGGLPRLKALSGAQVIASELEKPVIEGQIPIPRRSGGLRPPKTILKPTPVDRVVKDGDVLPEVMGGLRIVFTPGHAPGHLAFWQPAQRILFCGDAIFHTVGLRLPFALLTVDMAENKRSIKRLAELDASIVCFGHGDPLTQQAAQAIRDFARRIGAL